MIPQFALSALYRKQITDFLALPYTTNATKAQLVQQLYGLITVDIAEYARLVNTFPYELAVGPTEAQWLLHCSPTERRRWIQQGKIPVLYYRTLHYPRVTYPVHEREVMMNITQQEIASWRIEHRHHVHQQRSEAVIRFQEQKNFFHHIDQVRTYLGAHGMRSHFSDARVEKRCYACRCDQSQTNVQEGNTHA